MTLPSNSLMSYGTFIDLLQSFFSFSVVAGDSVAGATEDAGAGTEVEAPGREVELLGVAIGRTTSGADILCEGNMFYKVKVGKRAKICLRRAKC